MGAVALHERLRDMFYNSFDGVFGSKILMVVCSFWMSNF